MCPGGFPEEAAYPPTIQSYPGLGSCSLVHATLWGCRSSVGLSYGWNLWPALPVALTSWETTQGQARLSH